MTRETLSTILTVLAPLVLALLCALAAWVSRWLVGHLKNRRLALALELLSSGAALAVAKLYQTVVRDLKDPSKPGTWNASMARSVKEQALHDLRALRPEAIAVLEALGRKPSDVDAVLSAEIEKAVLALRLVTEGGRLPAPSALPVKTSTPAGGAL